MNAGSGGDETKPKSRSKRNSLLGLLKGMWRKKSRDESEADEVSLHNRPMEIGRLIRRIEVNGCHRRGASHHTSPSTPRTEERA